MVGVVYRFKIHNKLNGTLFYCYEYYRFLKQHCDVKFYVVGISEHDRILVNKVFSEKYIDYSDEIVPVESVVDLYRINLKQTLILDIDTFYSCKEFLTGHIHCFSNDTHDMFRYKNERQVIYYGVYDYQRFDVQCTLKLNFSIFKECMHNSAVFVSCPDYTHIKEKAQHYKKQFRKPLIMKRSDWGVGNLFDMIDHVHYVHTRRDTNNRIIPEAFYHNKKVTIEDLYKQNDSVSLRFNDIKTNGLQNYTLTEDDEMVRACLQSCS